MCVHRLVSSFSRLGANIYTHTDTQAIAAMRSASPEAASFPLYIHDGFDLQLFSDYVANHTDFIVQDNHSYFVYTASDVAESGDQHSGDVHGSVASALQKASDHEHRNIVVDEWSCALAPQSLEKEADPDASRKDFCTGQMEVYTNTTAGWGFWCEFGSTLSWRCRTY